MSSPLPIRLTALMAGAAALLLVLLTPGSGSPSLADRGRWPEAPSFAAADQAAELARLEREIEPLVEPVPRPVPAFSGIFDVPERLRPRVDFWVRVYTDVSSYQALVHDSYDLGCIYALVDLRDEPGVDARRFDTIRAAAKRVQRRYREHLRYLTLSKYDPDRLAGERRRLHHLLRARGGTKVFKGADRRVRIQRGLRDVLRESIVRSGRYIPRYKEIFRALGIPAELALLPHLESSFSHRARSYAGAVGIWQLTSGASRPHLHINSALDERVDPWRSAEVAALLLADNYRRLRNWGLAVTAYNQGVGAIKRAVRSTGSRDIADIIERYRSRNFGFAGRNFYAGFLAVVEVMQHYELHFGHLPIEPGLQPRRYRVKNAGTLANICLELGVGQEQVEALNPALRRSALSGSARLPRGAFLTLPPEGEGS